MNILRSQTGFSLMELIVATTIIGVLAIVVSEFYVQRLVDYARTDTLLILQSNTKQALETVERDVHAARTIETTNQWPDLNGPGGNAYGWASSTGSPSTLVLAVPVRDTAGNLIFSDSSHTSLLTHDVVFYVQGSQKTLYRRTILNPICTALGGTINCKDRATCPPASATANCPADAKIIEDVANMVVTYYDGNNAATGSVANVYSLDVTLTQSRNKFGRTYTNSLTSRASLRNKP